MSTNQPGAPGIPTSVPKSILTDEHYQQIKNGLAILDALQPHLDQAKRANIDVSAQQAAADDARTKLLALKNNYFPGR